MVYIQSWQVFQEKAEALYAESPTKTRYCVKWRSSEGKLVLKITDDTTCLKFKTYSSIFLNRFEALNLSLMQKMQNKRAVAPTIPTAATPQSVPQAAAEATQPSSTAPVPSGTASGGVKKKPKKKKK